MEQTHQKAMEKLVLNSVFPRHIPIVVLYDAALIDRIIKCGKDTLQKINDEFPIVS